MKVTKSDRFEIIHRGVCDLLTERGFGTGSKLHTAIIRDKVTGVNYLQAGTDSSRGLTVLLDKDGKPVVT